MDFSDWIDVFNFGMDRVQVLEMKRTSGLHRDWDPESGAPYIYIYPQNCLLCPYPRLSVHFPLFRFC